MLSVMSHDASSLPRRRLLWAAGISLAAHGVLLWPRPGILPVWATPVAIRAELKPRAQGLQISGRGIEVGTAPRDGVVRPPTPVGSSSSQKGSGADASGFRGVGGRPAASVGRLANNAAVPESSSRQEAPIAPEEVVAVRSLLEYRLQLARVLAAAGQETPPPVTRMTTVELRVGIAPGGMGLVDVADDGGAPDLAAWARVQVAKAVMGAGRPDPALEGGVVDLALRFEPGAGN